MLIAIIKTTNIYRFKAATKAAISTAIDETINVHRSKIELYNESRILGWYLRRVLLLFVALSVIYSIIQKSPSISVQCPEISNASYNLL